MLKYDVKLDDTKNNSTWCSRKVIDWERCARSDNAAASPLTWQLG